MKYVIYWRDGRGYVVKGQPNRKPYTPNTKEAQHWKSRAAAERFLKRKDPLWAANCTIEEIE